MGHLGADADVFHAIADETRRALLDRLRLGEERATVLSETFRISQPAVSQHLRVLRSAGLVAERREGRHRVYRLTPKPLLEAAEWLEPYRQFWIGRLRALGDLLEGAEPGRRPAPAPAPAPAPRRTAGSRRSRSGRRR